MVSWDDVVLKIDSEFRDKTIKVIGSSSTGLPSFLLRNIFHPTTLGAAYNEVEAETNISEMHTYVSFGESSGTFGRHCDEVDVLIVQSIGSVSYNFDDGKTVKLDPGDSLYIKRGVYHEPVVHGPRVTLSFSWLVETPF
jgi:ribosomal protein L16 Arg81 hydroxylase